YSSAHHSDDHAERAEEIGRRGRLPRVARVSHCAMLRSGQRKVLRDRACRAAHVAGMASTKWLFSRHSGVRAESLSHVERFLLLPLQPNMKANVSRALALLTVSSALSSACATTPSSDAEDDRPTSVPVREGADDENEIPCAPRAVLQTTCEQCHSR